MADILSNWNIAMRQPTYEDQLRAEEDIIKNYGDFQNRLAVYQNIKNEIVNIT